MKVYLAPPQPSRGLERIATALRRYAPPSVEVLTFPRNADLTVIYAIGRCEQLTRQAAEIIARGKKYAVVQVCLRSTMKPHVYDWYDLWDEATVVWSYYDLVRLCVEDDSKYWSPDNERFYHAPLGVDASVFKYSGASLKFTIATSGVSRLSESVRECYLAAKAVNGRLFHLGPDVLKDDLYVTAMSGISDEALAWRLSECEFVSGLRRTEGFELPAAEGLLCGSRPILFDSPDYRWNYKSWGEYIHEGSRQEVVDQLVQLFKQGVRPVTAHAREEAAHWFNWERIVGEFWQRCL